MFFRNKYSSHTCNQFINHLNNLYPKYIIIILLRGSFLCTSRGFIASSATKISQGSRPHQPSHHTHTAVMPLFLLQQLTAAVSRELRQPLSLSSHHDVFIVSNADTSCPHFTSITLSHKESTIMEHPLSESEIVSARLIFQKIDKDGDGVITHSELQSIMKTVARGEMMSSADITEMICEIDADDNGVIDFPEFLTMISTKSSTKWMSVVSALSSDETTIVDPITRHNRKFCILL